MLRDRLQRALTLFLTARAELRLARVNLESPELRAELARVLAETNPPTDSVRALLSNLEKP